MYYCIKQGINNTPIPDYTPSCRSLALANNTSNFSNDYVRKFPINDLPLEILYLVIERLDAHTFANCLHVSKLWKYIALRIANNDKSNIKWKHIFESYHEEETFKLKSNQSLSYKELFVNSLLWNYDFTCTLVNSCSGLIIEKINVFKDYLIVVDHEGVVYYDVKTLEPKRRLQINRCFDFNERDSIILRATEAPSNKEQKLLLYGKKSQTDEEFEIVVEIVQIEGIGDNVVVESNAILIDRVTSYALEDNSCYIIDSTNVLTCYTWRDYKEWIIQSLGRFYANQNDRNAINVLKSDPIWMTKWGQFLCFSYEKRQLVQSCCIRMPRVKNEIITLVHKYCVVCAVPNHCEFRITRFRNNNKYYLYRFECPKLNCVTQHGEMLFLGFSDGRVEIFTPRAPSREDIFKRRIDIKDFILDDIDDFELEVTSIDVYEDFGKHHLYISTGVRVYHFIVVHDDGIDVWDDIPEKQMYYKYPIRTKYVL